MQRNTPPGKLSATEVMDLYFLEVRSRLLDVAATLDRLDRAGGPAAADGPRMRFIHEALGILRSPEPERARRIAELYSSSI